MKKNILYCEANTDSTIGGSYYSLLHLLKNLDRSRFTPKVIFYTHNALIPEFNQNNINTVVLRKRKLKQTNNGRKNNSHLRTRLNLTLRKLINSFLLFPYSVMINAIFIKKNKIDLLHLNNGIKGNQEWMIAALLTHTPCITHQRGIFQSYSQFDLWLSKKLRKIICVSEAVKSNLLEHSFDTNNLITIHNAIDPTMMTIKTSRETLKSKHNIPTKTKIVGLPGNLKEWKGQEVAVRAMPSILKEHPNSTLLLVGDTSPGDVSYEKHLRNIVNKLNLIDNVIFAGHTSNIADYINVMDIVLHTSIEPEPFGRVIIEAMYLSKAVIGTKLGGAAEIISNEITGFKLEPRNVQLLALTVNKLLANPNLARKLGKNAKKRVIRDYHIDTNVRETQNIYLSVVAQTCPPSLHHRA